MACEFCAGLRRPGLGAGDGGRDADESAICDSLSYAARSHPGAQTSEGVGQVRPLVVCDLAYRNLTDKSQEKLKQLFNGKRGITVKGKGKLADRHYTSFNVGCLEEDELPRKHADDHFINVSRDTKAIEGKTCPHNGECIFAGIERDQYRTASSSGQPPPSGSRK